MDSLFSSTVHLPIASFPQINLSDKSSGTRRFLGLVATVTGEPKIFKTFRK